MKKLIAIVSLVACMMLVGAGSAFAAMSPAVAPGTPPSGTAGAGSTVTVTPAKDYGNAATAPSSITVGSDGSFSLDGFKFTEPGTYEYTVTDSDDPSKTYTITFTVGEDGKVSYTIKDQNGNTVTSMNFAAKEQPAPTPSGNGGSGTKGSTSGGTTSTTTKTTTSSTPAAASTTSKTGDVSMLVLGSVAGLAVIAGLVTVVSRRRSSQR